MTWKQYALIGLVALIVVQAPVTAGHFVSASVSGFMTFVHSVFHG